MRMSKLIKNISPGLHVYSLLGFILFFGFTFSIFLIENVLPGSTDSLGHIAFMQDHVNHFKELVKRPSIGYAFYPECGTGLFTESYWFETIIFMIPKALGFSDVFNSWFLVVILYALNSWAVYLLSYHYTQNRLAATFSGLSFSASCYMLGNIELMNSLGFFCIPLSLLLLELFIQSGNRKHFIRSLLLLSVSHFASAYAFLFGCGLWLCLFILKPRPVSAKTLVIAFSSFLLLIFPLVARLLRIHSDNVYNPLAHIPDAFDRFSMTFNNLQSALPNNLIYSQNIDHFADLAVKIPYPANSGFVFLILLIGSLFMSWHRKSYFLIISITALVFSFGLQVELSDYSIRLPLYYLQKIPGISTFFRIPGRAFVVTQFGFAILAGHGLAIISSKLSKIWSVGLPIVAMLAFVIENVPVLMAVPSDQDRPRLNTPVIYQSLPKTKVRLAILPSSLFTDGGYHNGISEFSREYHYQYWQITHGHYIINGSSSYFPTSRMRNNQLMIHLDENDNLNHLIDSNGIELIIFHQEFTFDAREKGQLKTLEESPRLVLIQHMGGDYLFEVIKNLEKDSDSIMLQKNTQ